MSRFRQRAKFEKVTGFSVMRQSAGLLVLSIAVGILVNHARPEGLSLTKDWSREGRPIENSDHVLFISVDEAKNLFLSEAAVFLDARSPEDYDRGHILGASNLPWEVFDEYFDVALSNVSDDTTIIAYCDGETCSLGEHVARELVLMGYEDVRVLVNGWSLWKERQLPTESLSLGVSNTRKPR